MKDDCLMSMGFPFGVMEKIRAKMGFDDCTTL